jgi:type II secretory pathway pseudopilin PulG
LVIVFSTLALVPALRVRGEVVSAAQAATAKVKAFQGARNATAATDRIWLCRAALKAASFQLAGLPNLTNPNGGSCTTSGGVGRGTNGPLTVTVTPLNHSAGARLVTVTGGRYVSPEIRVCVRYSYNTSSMLVLLLRGTNIQTQQLGTLTFEYCGSDRVDEYRTR